MALLQFCSYFAYGNKKNAKLLILISNSLKKGYFSNSLTKNSNRRGKAPTFLHFNSQYLATLAFLKHIEQIFADRVSRF